MYTCIYLQVKNEKGVEIVRVVEHQIAVSVATVKINLNLGAEEYLDNVV